MKRLFLGFGALFLAFLLTGCGNTSSTDTSSKQSVMLTLANNSATLKNGEADIDFDTNKGATYSATDAETGDKLLDDAKAKTGSVTITANSAGTYEIKVTYKGKTKKALFVVKPGKTESASSESSSDEPFALNQEAVMKNNDDNEKYLSLTLTSITNSFDAHGQGLINSDMPGLSISKQKSIQVTFNYKNYGLDSYLPSLDDFAVYDDNGTAGTIVNQQEGQTEVTEGHSALTTFWVNMPEDVSQIKTVNIEYTTPDASNVMKFAGQIK